MPLRKKHVRRALVILLLLLGLAPAGALTWYGLLLRSGAVAHALKDHLESRLRCAALVRGLRAQGPGVATADVVQLEWSAAEGSLTLLLENLRAERNVYGWYIAAKGGALHLRGPRPRDTLAALNQRLVQVDGRSPLMALTVERLAIAMDLGEFRLVAPVRATASSNMTQMVLEFRPVDAPARTGSQTESADGAPAAAVRLSPTSPRGVFDGMRLNVRGLPESAARRAMAPDADDAAQPATGSLDVTGQWEWPENGSPPVDLKVEARGLDLARWTSSVPGGPVVGVADVTVRYIRGREGPGTLDILITSEAGRASARTLAWLEGLPAGLKLVGPPAGETVSFGRMHLACHVEGLRGRITGLTGTSGESAVLVAPAGEGEAPIMQASTGQFDAPALWADIRPLFGPSASVPAPPSR